MRSELLDVLVCPRCQGVLTCRARNTSAEGDVVDGELRCAKCGRDYPVERGIPRFVPPENYASSFGYQWNRFRQEQIDACNGTRQSERRFRAETEWDDTWLSGKWVVEGGCGAGRFIDVVSRLGGCQVIGVDLSNAVDAAAETLRGRSNVHFVQASILELPFRPDTLDGSYCIGVIQHTPDPARAVSELARVVKPGGRLALTAYERRRFTFFHSKYWFRPLTRRLKGPTLLRLIKVIMPIAFGLSELLFRLPVLNRAFRFLLPVANYVDAVELSLAQRYQWAVLDTFDMFAPAYDTPQREGDVVQRLTACGFEDVRRLPNAGLNLVGTKSAVLRVKSTSESAAGSPRVCDAQC